MKISFIHIFLVFFSEVIFAQPLDTISFEKNANLVQIDYTQSNNIWQIGRPQKLFFDSAYSAPLAILTDTINPYPIDDTSSFQFYIYDTINTWGDGFAIPYLEFQQKFQMDTLTDKGFIEFSYDMGNTWKNAFKEKIISILNYTYDDSTKFITGTSSGWYCGVQMFFHDFCTPTTDTILVKFTFISDGVQTNKAGWMIDNIIFGSTLGCSGIKEYNDNNLFTIYPNPTNNKFTIAVNNPINAYSQDLSIYDLFGRTIKNLKNLQFIDNKIEINISDLEKGIYFVELTNRKNKEKYSQKIVVD